MRRLIKLLPYIAVLLVILIAVAVFWRAGPLRKHARDAIAAELARQTDRDVSVRDLGLSPTGRVVLHDLEIRNRDGSALLVAPEAAVRLGRPKRLSASAVATALRSITLRRPEITLTRDVSRKWSIDDLLRRKPKAPSQFTGDVYIEQGRLTVIDEAQGGAKTVLEAIALRLRQPKAGQVDFRLRARGTDNAFDALEASGQVDSKAGTVDASGSVSDLDLGYAYARLPEIRAFTISAGRADLKGKLSLGPGAKSQGLAGLAAEGEVKEAEISFPWLRKPVTAVHGKLRFTDSALHLDDVQGLLNGAPIKVTGAISDFTNPQLALDLSATGLRYDQLKALLPKLYVPVTLVLPAPLRLSMRIEGPARNLAVDGRADMRVVKFHLIPWHDLVATFSYTQGRLKVRKLRAHGSPRRLEADIDVEWGKGKRTQTSASFRLDSISLATLATMAGLEGTGFEGIAQISGSLRLDGGQSVVGEFTIEDAAFRDVPLGRISGQFVYSGDAVLLRDVRITSKAVRGKVSGRVTAAGKYDLRGDFARLDLSAVGRLLGRPDLRGEFPATARASGDLRAGRAAGWLEIGPGQVQGRAFEFLRSSFDISPQRARLSEVEIRLPHGGAQGQLEIRDWARGQQRAAVSGAFTITGVDPRDWLPAPYAEAVSRGVVGGAVEVAGTLADPRVLLSLAGDSLGLRGRSFPRLRARITYQAGVALVEDIELEEEESHLSVSGLAQLRREGPDWLVERVDLAESRTGLRLTGGESPAGLSFDLSGDGISLADVAAPARPRLGLVIEGTASLHAVATGSRAHPRVAFRATASGLLLNDLPLADITIAGQFADGKLALDEPIRLRQADSEIALSGAVGIHSPAPPTIDVTVDLRQLDLLTAQTVVDRGLWRLHYSEGRDVPAGRYFALLAPIGGRVEGQLKVTGELDRPEAHLSLALHEFIVGGRRVDLVEAKLAGLLTLDQSRRVGLKRLELALHARHREADVYVDGGPGPGVVWSGEGERALGWIAPGEDMFVLVESRNFELALLKPWLAYGPEFEALDLAGKADINFDITGEPSQPMIRGDVSVDDLHLGPFRFENARAYPILLQRGFLTVEDLSFRHGPTLGSGRAAIPLGRSLIPTRAEFHVTRGELAPVPGMTPLIFDADLHLQGNRLFLRTVDEQGQTQPGIRGVAGSGTFAATGEVEVRSLSLAELDRNICRIALDLNAIDLLVPGLVDGKLTGSLLLLNDPATGRLQLRSGPDPARPPEDQPLVFSHATVTLPRGPLGGPGALPLLTAPELRLSVLVGEDVWFRFGAPRRPTEIRVDTGSAGPIRSGYLDIGGLPSPSGIVLTGEARSHYGTLAFPNGALTLRRGEVRIWTPQNGQSILAGAAAGNSRETEADRSPGLAQQRQPGGEAFLVERPTAGWVATEVTGQRARLRVWIRAEADGRIGEYYVSLSPVGQVYPPPEHDGAGYRAPGVPPPRGYDLNAVSIPSLDEAYILALLAGSVTTPSRAGGRDVGDLLANAGGGGAGGGEITGIVLPTFGSVSGIPEVSLDVALQGPTRLRIGERLFNKLLVSYVSPLSGPSGRPAMRITYEVTPRWSVGWSFDELDRVRWEGQAFVPF